MPTKKTVKYKVLNPKSIPQGIPILSWKDFNWYEGDVFECPQGMKVERILAGGYVMEVKGG